MVWEIYSYGADKDGSFFRDPQPPEQQVRCLKKDCPIDDQFAIEEDGGGFAHIIHDDHIWKMRQRDPLHDVYDCRCGARKEVFIENSREREEIYQY